MRASNHGERRRPVLLTVSGVIPADISAKILNGERPRADYLSLARGLNADLIDYAKAREVTGIWGRLVALLFGCNVLLALACWWISDRYESIVTDGEQVGLPLAALLMLTGDDRSRHVMITHVISVPKKAWLIDILGLHHRIDCFVVYCSWQKNYIVSRWHLPADRVAHIPFMVDEDFFNPSILPSRTGLRPLVSAVGLERRDYDTLMEAVDGLDIDVVVAAASPWSKQKDKTEGRQLPANVTVRKFSQFDLRQLYADSDLVVMPLQPVDFQAGITAILEAMAMGRCVVCSHVPGQTDTICDRVTGTYVPCKDPKALRSEIVRLLGQAEESAAMGARARETVVHHFGLGQYVDRMAGVLRAVAAQ